MRGVFFNGNLYQANCLLKNFLLPAVSAAKAGSSMGSSSRLLDFLLRNVLVAN
jgi:hypothetical protein